MRKRALLAVLLMCASSCPVLGQERGNNPSAEAILSKLLQVTRWSNPPKDAVATGRVRGADDTGDGVPITVTGKGKEQIRFDVVIEGRTASTIINGKKAARIKNDSVRKLPVFYAVSNRVPVFPFFTNISHGRAFESVRHLGTETVNGEVLEIIELLPKIDMPDQSARYRARADHYKLWISKQSELLVQIEYITLSAYSPFAEQPILRRYSDYREVSGRAFPFHQEQFINGVLNTSVQFDNVSFDIAVPDETFAIPESQ